MCLTLKRQLKKKNKARAKNLFARNACRKILSKNFPLSISSRMFLRAIKKPRVAAAAERLVSRTINQVRKITTTAAVVKAGAAVKFNFNSRLLVIIKP